MLVSLAGAQAVLAAPAQAKPPLCAADVIQTTLIGARQLTLEDIDIDNDAGEVALYRVGITRHDTRSFDVLVVPDLRMVRRGSSVLAIWGASGRHHGPPWRLRRPQQRTQDRAHLAVPESDLPTAYRGRPGKRAHPSLSGVCAGKTLWRGISR